VIRYGIVTTYDRNRRAGVLTPDNGSAPIVFSAADQPDTNSQPSLFQRYRYDLFVPLDGGQPRAIKLHHQPGCPEQLVDQRPVGNLAQAPTNSAERRAKMDLNELLHAHQVAVMSAAASGDENHYGKISEYAERIRQLRTISQATSVEHDPAAPPTIIYGSYAGETSIDGVAAIVSQRASGSMLVDSENPDRGQADR
jgi:hypothetical protein